MLFVWLTSCSILLLTFLVIRCFYVQYEMYVPMRSPASIEEWLTDLNLRQYMQMFIDAGWDHVKFIDGMTIEDLSDVGVTNKDHQTRILESIASLRSLN